MYAMSVLCDVNIKNSFKSRLKVLYGIVIGNSVYIILSVFTLSLINVKPEIKSILNIISGFIILYLGIISLVNFLNNKNYFFNGFLVTIFNPKAIIFYQMLLVPLVSKYNMFFKILTAIYFISATFILIFLNFYFSNFLKHKIEKYIKYLNFLFGLALILFGGFGWFLRE